MKHATIQSLPSIARCHRKAFPKSLSASLGQRYVERMLEWYLLSDSRFLFFIEENNQVLGYCGGMIQDGSALMGSSSGMAQQSFWAAVKALALRPWVLMHPELRNKYRFIWRNIKIKLGLKKLKPPVTQYGISPGELRKKQEPEAGLVVIGVDPAHQGKGFGTLLLKAFEQHCATVYGVNKLQLSVRADNTQAIRAYERNGWKISKEQAGSILMERQVSFNIPL